MKLDTKELLPYKIKDDVKELAKKYLGKQVFVDYYQRMKCEKAYLIGVDDFIRYIEENGGKIVFEE